MATSGTIGQTTISTSKVLEHALRRCRVKPQLQTPEVVATALENLYLLLSGPLATQGLNLWCVETQYVGLQENQATYTLPVGTIDVLSLTYSQPTQLVTADSTTATSITLMADGTMAVRLGFKATSIAATETITIAVSADDVTYTTLTTETRQDWENGTWYWFRLDPASVGPYFKISAATAITFAETCLASSIYDLPLAQWNRDDWAALNNKVRLGRPSTNFYLERHLTPQVTLWPVPNNSLDHLTLIRHRQIQDIGSLQQELELPTRWVEPIIWQLSGRLCYELDTVAPDLIPVITQMADKVLREVASDETDGSPLRLQPSIGVYTR